MRTFFSFLLALLASLFVSQIVAQMLAIQFHSREEFIAVMALLFLFAIVCIVVLSLAYLFGGNGVALLDRVSLVLSGLVVTVTIALTIFGMSQSDWAWPGPYDFKLIAEILFPALLVVAVQWALLRRRRARAA
ncbi:MAG: hypothetical protein K2X60_13625 [Xanthobacteraceae bacterium]|nr:hypothetical protein [Xanthobacteraceae bacterium]